MFNFGSNVARMSWPINTHSTNFSSFVRKPNRIYFSSKIEKNQSLDQLAELAIPLISGSRQYTEFSKEEKNIVNRYQRYWGKVEGVLFPNTRAYLESEKGRKLIKELNDRS